jgi:hypothetical protein
LRKVKTAFFLLIKEWFSNFERPKMSSSFCSKFASQEGVPFGCGLLLWGGVGDKRGGEGEMRLERSCSRCMELSRRGGCGDVAGWGGEGRAEVGRGAAGRRGSRGGGSLGGSR